MDKDEVRKAIEAVRNGCVPISEAGGVASRKPDRERDLALEGAIGRRLMYREPRGLSA